ncbi:MAG: DNA-directed RNA polymerase sigma-70 factor [Saprospiraceae bacterium]|nr:MAG: DNA-directed RNA polymerase sigma-70 factor [Saprospiraceae bacterium]
MFIRTSDNHKYQHWTDQELLDAFREYRTEACFAELFERYVHLAFLAALKFLKDREQSKDVTMIIFSKIFDILQKETPKSFNKWLFTIVRNECISYMRSHYRQYQQRQDWEKNQKSEDFFMENEGFERLIDRSTPKKENALMAAMTRLEGKQQKCLELFYFEKKSYKEIARLTQSSVKQVKSHLQNGKRQLRRQLLAFSEECE